MQVDDVMTKKNGNKTKTIIITTTILKDQDYNNNRFKSPGHKVLDSEKDNFY